MDDLAGCVGIELDGMTSFARLGVAPEKAVFRPALPLRSLPGLYGADMTERIGAIETRYAGHLFRSRLEARWAVFFDQLKIEWTYEPQGFECGQFKYLPDFYLPSMGIWVEVKGDPNALFEDRKRMTSMLAHGGPMPNVHQDVIDPLLSVDRGLLVLGDIPRDTQNIVFHPIYSNIDSQGVVLEWAAFVFASKATKADLYRCGRGFLDIVNLLRVRTHIEAESATKEDWMVDARVSVTENYFQDVRDAYQAARQARFEHGATGV